MHLTLVRDEHRVPSYYLAQLQDISERKRLEAELIHQALHDSLTGLPNRALLKDRLIQRLAGTRQHDTQLGVIFCRSRPLRDQRILRPRDGRRAARHVAADISPRRSARATRSRASAAMNSLSSARTSRPQHDQDRRRGPPRHPPAAPGRRARINLTVSLGVALSDRPRPPESLLRDSDAAMFTPKASAAIAIEVFDDALARTRDATADHRRQPGPRARATRTRGLLPTRHRPGERHAGQRRSTAALAAPRPGDYQPGRIHPTGRRDRPDRRHRHVGPRSGLPAIARMAGHPPGHVDGSQLVRPPDPGTVDHQRHRTRTRGTPASPPSTCASSSPKASSCATPTPSPPH